MSKSIMKKILMFGSIFLFTVVADTYATSGPCWDADDGCGGFYVGPNTCKDIGIEGDCSTGSCPWYVPEGAPNEYCAELWGECTQDYGAFCSTIKTYTCGGVAAGCYCFETGTGGSFTRTGC